MIRLREPFERLAQNGITRVAFTRLGDPAVIPLWFGEGDVPTPEFIREAAKAALDAGDTFYQHTRGRAELRGAIKTYLDRLYRVDLDPDRITVPGSSMLGITLAAQMTCGDGDHGLVVSPNWPNIENTFQVTGAEVGHVRQRYEDGRWHLPLADVVAALRPHTRAIFVNSPCNPTGWVMSRAEQEALLELCRDRGIVIISDEVYHRHVFDGTEAAPSFLEIARDDDPVIVVNGFSKAWAMTGWRLGWMVTPSRYVEQMDAVSECFNTGSTVFCQAGGVAALERGEGVVRELRDRYARGREQVVRRLGGDPRVEIGEPAGAFYAFPRIPGLRSSLDFVRGVLAEEDVGLAPGYTFGPGNEEHFRLCFARSGPQLDEALGRVLAYLDRHHNELVGG